MRLSTAGILAIALTYGMAIGQVIIVFHPGDTLTATGQSFVQDKATATFSGSGNPAARASWLSLDRRSASFKIPPGATSGPVAINSGSGTTGTIQVEIIPVSNPVTSSMQGLFTTIQGNVLLYLIALAGLGVLTMSIIQAAKSLFPYIRRTFLKNFTIEWLKNHADSVGAKQGPDKSGDPIDLHEFKELADSVLAEQELVLLAADNDATALYNSESDDFCKQLSAVALLVVDYPSCYPELFTVLAANADPHDYILVMRGGGAPASGRTQELADDPTNEDVRNAHDGKRVRHAREHPPTRTAGEPRRQRFEALAQSMRQPVDDLGPAEQAKAQMNAKNRIRQLVAQSMSAFQLRLNWRWGAGLRYTSFSISFAIAAFALWLGNQDLNFGVIFVSALGAAFFAPVARDLVATIEKLRS